MGDTLTDWLTIGGGVIAAGPIGGYIAYKYRLGQVPSKTEIQQEAATAIKNAGGSPDDVAATVAQVGQVYDSTLSELQAQDFGDPLNNLSFSVPNLLPSSTSLLTGSAIVIVILVLIAFIVFKVG